ncbi:hypothetical protein TEA_027586 [Camellia sinensis var. sinensis]|uniref:Uncharacterized protein n=1 Tax=Camellia sinensis var. sinensis TaxID=542762 RepID=A0A4S4EMI5_CAMSN|nr:hypothetical protein TEA_027586 [Camellia sinensis var. sinensis]
MRWDDRPDDLTVVPVRLPALRLSEAKVQKVQVVFIFFIERLRFRRLVSRPSSLLQWRPRSLAFPRRRSAVVTPRACEKLEEKNVLETGIEWGKVSAVLFDMDGVLCNSEEPSRMAAVDVFAEMGVEVSVEDFVPFMGTVVSYFCAFELGEANFLGGVASVKGVEGFNIGAAKKRFFEIYLDKYAKPNSGIGFPGAFELINQCKSKGLKVAVASSADRIKVDANLAAAGLPVSMFDAIVSADAFENLKPAPDIFLAASKILNVPTSECIVIEDALAGVQAAKAAQMRCIAVTTTLSEETLKTASPSLIRQEIGSVSLDDILSGGSGCHNEKMQGSQFVNSSAQTSPALLKDRTESRSFPDTNSANDMAFSIGGLQGSRRDILRYGSLGIAISCLVFTITNWKAMQYTSPKALWNSLFGVSTPSFQQNEGVSRSARVQQFVNYISDLETRGTARIVPEFPSKLDWLNTVPLKLSRVPYFPCVVSLHSLLSCICISTCGHLGYGLDVTTLFQEVGMGDLGYIRMRKSLVLQCVFQLPTLVIQMYDAESVDHLLINCPVALRLWMHIVANFGLVLGTTRYCVGGFAELGWGEFTVVGVHSAKFDNEKDLEAIRNAVLRYGITHPVSYMLCALNCVFLVSACGHAFKDLFPSCYLHGKSCHPPVVVNDGDMYLWHELGINSWPTFAIVGPNGKLLAQISGEGRRKVVTDLDGNFIVQIGSTGEEGFRDGNFEDATFNRPQGLAYDPKKNLLYVADTENHALRVIDFVNETVQTLAGNGTKGVTIGSMVKPWLNNLEVMGSSLGVTTLCTMPKLLNSPWDVCYEPVNGIVYIAMAGQHQIWEHNTSDGITRAFSGDGYERNLNGSS